MKMLKKRICNSDLEKKIKKNQDDQFEFTRINRIIFILKTVNEL